MTQLGTCTVKIEHNNKHKICKYFAVPGNGQALLGMSDLDMLNIINININSIGTEHGGGNDNCCTNKANSQNADMTHETDGTKKCYTNTGSISKSDNADKPTVNDKLSNTIDYFFPGPNCDSDRTVSVEITQELQRDFKDVLNGIGYFDCTFFVQLRPDSKPYQVSPICMAHMLQKPFEEKLKRLQKQDIVASLGVDESAKWCNSFVLVPKANGRVKVCLDPSLLNQTLIRLVHSRPTLNDILPKFNNAKNLSLIGVSFGYHKLKLDE